MLITKKHKNAENSLFLNNVLSTKATKIEDTIYEPRKGTVDIVQLVSNSSFIVF